MQVLDEINSLNWVENSNSTPKTMILYKRQFYQKLLEAVQKKMKDEGIIKQDIKDKLVEFPLSNSSIRIIEKIAAGENVNGFSEKRIMNLIEEFNLGSWEIAFRKTEKD